MEPFTECVLVSYDLSDDGAVLLVGRQKGKNVEIINFFTGDEATELFKRITVTDKKNDKEKR